MQLIVIGSGTGALQVNRGSSGYILKRGKEIFLLDGGSGTLKKCLDLGISYKEIDKLFYTHLHPDHTIDLIPFLFATKHTPGFRRTNSLDIYGPVGFQSFYHEITELYGTGITDVDYVINITELNERHLFFGDWKLETRLMQHSQNAIGYRFEVDERVFVYSGDTDYCEGIIKLSQNADVLVLECSFPDPMKVPGHLTPTEAGKIAAAAGVKKLILTHLYPPCKEENILPSCLKHFPGDVMMAMDTMRVEI